MHGSRYLVVAGGAALIATATGGGQPASSVAAPAGHAPFSIAALSRTDPPALGLVASPGDARFPAKSGTNVAGMDILSTQLKFDAGRHTLTVYEQVIDLLHPEQTARETGGGNFQQYVTRWQMGPTVYFAEMENTLSDTPRFFAGRVENVPVCSVSSCGTAVPTYPEPALQHDPAQSDVRIEHGMFMCPSSPSASQPCTLSIKVKLDDVGNPGMATMLEQVGSYSFASSHPAGYVGSEALARSSSLPTLIDSVCCFNFQASAVRP